MNGKLEKQQSRHLDPDTPLRPWGSTLGLASGPGVPAGVVPGSLAGPRCLSDAGGSVCLARGAARSIGRPARRPSLPSLTPRDILLIFITW